VVVFRANTVPLSGPVYSKAPSADSPGLLEMPPVVAAPATKNTHRGAAPVEVGLAKARIPPSLHPTYSVPSTPTAGALSPPQPEVVGQLVNTGGAGDAAGPASAEALECCAL
jgi:hypothetical protein